MVWVMILSSMLLNSEVKRIFAKVVHMNWRNVLLEVLQHLKNLFHLVQKGKDCKHLGIKNQETEVLFRNFWLQNVRSLYY